MILTLEFDSITEEKLSAIARQEGLDTSALVNKLVNERLAADVNGNYPGYFGGRTVGEVFGHLFGTAKGGPQDMAAHPEQYMEDFWRNERPPNPEAMILCDVP